MRCKGLAGNAVFRNSTLLLKSQVNQSSVLQIPPAPELERLLRCAEQMGELTTSNDWPASLRYANQTFDQHFHFDNRLQATIIKAKVLVNSPIMCKSNSVQISRY